MFKRLMASLGVGTSKVNLVLDKDMYRIGEQVKGKIIIEGGNVDQEINSLDIDVVMKFNIKGKEFTRVVDTIKVARNFRVRAKEKREVPYEYYLPYHFPITKGSVSYYLATRMDIAKAVDTGDRDKFVVMPGRDMELILSALEQLGFKEKIGSGKIGRYGQEFDYYPTTLYEDRLKEMDVKFFRDEQSIKMFLELKIASSHLLFSKHYTELAVPLEMLARESPAQVSEYIKDFLTNEINYVISQGPNTAPAYHNYQHHHGHNSRGSLFGGFMGGMVAGLLGAAMFESLFNAGENEDAGDAGDVMSGSEESGDAGFDFGLGDFGDDMF